MKGIKHRDPMKTKNGRTRLGPLSIAQLEELIGKTSIKKEKDRLQTRLAHLNAKKNKENLKLTADKQPTL